MTSSYAGQPSRQSGAGWEELPVAGVSPGDPGVAGRSRAGNALKMHEVKLDEALGTPARCGPGSEVGVLEEGQDWMIAVRLPGHILKA